ncbi:MAG: ABC transporter permease [Patescibacteria group bacterium]
MISPQRIRGVLIQQWHITRRSLEVIMDIPFFAFIGVVVFGYISQATLGSIATQTGQYLILGAMLWEVMRISQYSMTVSAFWNVWSRNLGNMFVSPLSLTEFLLAQMAQGILTSGGVFLVLIPLAGALFKFNMFSMGPLALVMIFINLLLFSWSVGLVLLGCVFRFGTRVQALGWALIFIFQPLCGVYYPMSIIPEPFHSFAFLFPITYVFEGARETLLMGNPALNWQVPALMLNILYFICSLLIFKYLLLRAQETGQFARNES